MTVTENKYVQKLKRKCFSQESAVINVTHSGTLEKIRYERGVLDGLKMALNILLKEPEDGE